MQVEQGLGIGTKAPLFNRMEAQVTRFVKLTNPRGKSAPVTVVAHGKVGNTIGDLPAYDAFLLGGPYSGEREGGRGGRAHMATLSVGKSAMLACDNKQ